MCAGELFKLREEIANIFSGLRLVGDRGLFWSRGGSVRALILHRKTPLPTDCSLIRVASSYIATWKVKEKTQYTCGCIENPPKVDKPGDADAVTRPTAAGGESRNRAKNAPAWSPMAACRS